MPQKGIQSKNSKQEGILKAVLLKNQKICSKQVNQQTHFQVLSQKINNVLNTLNLTNLSEATYILQSKSILVNQKQHSILD